MSVEQLLPQILALEPFEREKLLLEISNSIGDRDGHYVEDEEVDRRMAELDKSPEDHSVSSDEFRSFVESRRKDRRSS